MDAKRRKTQKKKELRLRNLLINRLIITNNLNVMEIRTKKPNLMKTAKLLKMNVESKCLLLRPTVNANKI